ncbi:MAG: zinc-binding alcohol dehydrogenase family protein [Bacteroidales bacterium]|jgi:2-desacetyl-2-hydroxyethyl bacteriochlorophyllide A dehydrogenase|nr:zinc-binding alcohol dehydrogenase family protein [Bacteroidales bacterium]
MKAVQIIQPGKIQVIEIPMPEIQSEDLLLKVHYVGFCGSDLNTYLGKNPMVRFPVIPGHEIGAVIEKAGEKCPPHLKPGMSCTVNPYTSCGNCSSCRNGKPNACRYNQTMGVQRDGSMCEYIAVPWQKVIPDPRISPKEFCLVEPMSVGFHAISRARITDLDTVMVIGCGMIGMGAVTRAALRGAKIIAVDMDDKKLQLAKLMGAMFTINSRTENLHDRLQEITQGYGPDVVIEAVGAPGTYRMAIDEAAFTGRVVYIGYAKQEVAFETKLFVQKELDILGSRNAMPEDFRAVIEYIKKGTCPVNELISGIYSPGKAQEALEKWTGNPGSIFRILLEF